MGGFDTQNCVLCNEHKNEKLHLLGTDKKLEETREVEFQKAVEECPESLAAVKIRAERAYDTRAGDLVYHETCWVVRIKRRIPDYRSKDEMHTGNQDAADSTKNATEFGSCNSSANACRFKALALTEIVASIKKAQAVGRIYDVRQAVQAYDAKIKELGSVDERQYSSKRKWLMAQLKHTIKTYLRPSNFSADLF